MKARTSPAFSRRFLALGLICLLAAAALLVSHWQSERVRVALIELLEQPLDQEAVVERVNLIVPTAPYFAAALGFIGLACFWSTRHRETTSGTPAGPVIAGLVIVIVFLPWLAGRLGPLFSARRVALAVQRNLSPNDKFVFFRRYYRTLPFYLERPGILWNGGWDEFGRWPDAEELSRSILQKRPEALRALWAGPGRAVAIVCGIEDLTDFRKYTAPSGDRVIGKFGRVVILENRPFAIKEQSETDD